MITGGRGIGRAARVALFLPSLNGGGAERVAVTLANGIAARGFAVDLVLARAQGPYLADVGRDVRIVDLKAGRVVRALLPLVRYWRRERPVAMLSFMNHANVVAVLAHRLAGRPGRLVVSERVHIGSEAPRAHGLQRRLVYALVPWAYRRADGVTAVSREAARDLERFARLPAGRVQAIYNPFDLARIDRLARERAPHPWSQADERPVIVAAGRLTEQKDFPTLLRAFAQVRRQRPVRLLILGEGELRGELEALARQLGLTDDEVQLPGFARNPYAYFARAALFVLSSRWEGLPGVLIEAMACGAPVVATDCPSGPREILEDGRWGPLVPVGDADALARAMLAVLATPPDQRPDVRLRARDFDQERAVDAYLDVLGLPRQAAQEARR
ncbi:N-acetylgalactosamine-N,N'-diacetylbacillosaminyl-diphospho-undecaprenol 4-alpha-N-acetylgalactosaminyltransferase [Tepidimonas alkaliphilus]|uniref:N-acetylgalactosamine-N, N'-diacetylbacillosaminyl-diphospho-undecaprenol 4-alpha-N-acetylgalactosaminyltransferase n=1 Tax=Tepidimonas alkaliphilus TaxID=2588942 RepID=A0A554W3S0_9BURK|nr:glycosyltransferase [Tepidimonas alkaliphilus]TSE18224.1 N-acetylgalactosamine-N,N'-diacetylbacillosaminyl-diphospho-undecaprenol 4-alpha-N-acetylgalactosaminyltransferase [Tepidimonas alkaliphilus]